MSTHPFWRLALAATFVCLSPEVFAQRGGGKGGGGMCRGGMGSSGAMNGAMAGRMGRSAGMAGRRGPNSTGANGMAGMNMRNQMNGPVNSFQRNTMPQPTPNQFVQTAMQFDRDNDQQLSRDELNIIASVVISELQSRQPLGRSRRQQSRRSQRSGSINSSQPSMEEAFVNRAMTFDRNNDGALSTSETTQMARALIRSLS
jgi:Ca2+-binding EF-hand superfamily protein